MNLKITFLILISFVIVNSISINHLSNGVSNGVSSDRSDFLPLLIYAIYEAANSKYDPRLKNFYIQQDNLRWGRRINDGILPE